MRKKSYDAPAITVYQMETAAPIMAASTAQQEVSVEIDNGGEEYDGVFRAQEITFSPWDDVEIKK